MFYQTESFYSLFEPTPRLFRFQKYISCSGLSTHTCIIKFNYIQTRWKTDSGELRWLENVLRSWHEAVVVAWKNVGLSIVLLLRYYCATIALLLRSYCAPIALLLRYYCATIALLLRYYCAPIALLLRYYCAPIALLLRYYCAKTSFHVLFASLVDLLWLWESIVGDILRTLILFDILLTKRVK